MLKRGSKGQDVLTLQQKLRKLGLYSLPLDGEYGPGTFNAVKTFQERYQVTGVADRDTLDLLDELTDGVNDGFSVPQTLQEVEDTYGKIEYREDPEPHWGKHGWVIVTNNWKEEYLRTVDLPIVGKLEVNKVVAPHLIEVLSAIDDLKLDYKIKEFYCYAARHKLHNPKRGLSIHSWAAAVDINPKSNGLGTVGDLDPQLVFEFESRGWVWGGKWRYSDPMHFQLCAATV